MLGSKLRWNLVLLGVVQRVDFIEIREHVTLNNRSRPSFMSGLCLVHLLCEDSITHECVVSFKQCSLLSVTRLIQIDAVKCKNVLSNLANVNLFKDPPQLILRQVAT